ncbi:peptide deformylase [Sulfurimonas sp. HSL-3221]|uniref:peptide deformylase n=1 Tax=Sulfurimonadaceae TaxID=2771471 RepID=UPI001E6020D7|nr:peptide deformylase [Sulfurimonas sp. HSL-3221]UFS62014.1 peptide deformylase [Sulfurimonas sp. HSL-3221]
MIQPLLKYPDPRIRLISGNVRFFNETLKDIIADMTDTMEANGLDALSAIQIGIQYNVIVLKEEDAYTPYINARFLKEKGKAAAVERSTYYDFTAEVERYTSLTVIYEDETGAMHSRDVEGELARTFQHQLDYAFGSTFVDRVPKAVRQQIDAYLDQGLVKESRMPGEKSGSCPTVFVRDYIKKAYRLVMLGVLLSFIAPFTVEAATVQTIAVADMAALGLIFVLIIAYFFYAEYEAKKYKQCTSCQTGNIIGTAGIALGQLALLAVGVFAWVLP